MPEVERGTRKDEEYGEEEEEKKFPVWIIPLVAGPVLLIILIAALAGSRPTETNGQEEVFNEPQLKKDANDLLMKASKLYHDAMRLQNQKQRDELLDKAMPLCDEAIKKLYEIQDYYEEHNIQHKKGGIWDWEKILKEASVLAYDIQKAHGF